MTLKTLKEYRFQEKKGYLSQYFVKRLDLKRKAVKWVKEDFEMEKRLHPDDKNIWLICLQRWTERLNITEEDLK